MKNKFNLLARLMLSVIVAQSGTLLAKERIDAKGESTSCKTSAQLRNSPLAKEIQSQIESSHFDTNPPTYVSHKSEQISKMSADLVKNYVVDMKKKRAFGNDEKSCLIQFWIKSIRIDLTHVIGVQNYALLRSDWGSLKSIALQLKNSQALKRDNEPYELLLDSFETVEEMYQGKPQESK